MIGHPRGGFDATRCGLDISLHTANDAAFAAYAESTVEDGATSTGELERRLRAEYPRAVVHARQLSDELDLIWYLYRDGRWNRP